jgi:hypothetical protein
VKPFTKEGWYQITVPDDWEVDAEDTPVATYHPEGVGALQITAESPKSRKAGERIDVFLVMRAFLKSIGVTLDEKNARRWSKDGLEWATTEYEGESPDGPIFWRLWFATNHDVLAFFTYACPAEDRDAERATVDEILKSVVLF